MSEGLRRAAQFGGAAVVGAALVWGFTMLRDNDEERPPIVVEDGSVHIGPQYPSANGDWGEWRRQGTSPVWHYSHYLDASGFRTGVINGTCTTSGTVPTWRYGPLRISYTDGTNTYSFALLMTNGVTMVRTNPNEPEPTIDGQAPWRLTFEGAVRLSGLTSEGAGTMDACSFGARGPGAIMVEQQQ